ncbi:MAG: outer membrane lipoprotein-sorting protein, partial [Maribacter sp.]|nr:outer membrane lipoprotein-sorting protein [Maribacter sp.]
MIKLLYFVLALPFCLQISYAEMTGKEIMEKQKNRHELKYEQMSIEMILENKKGRKKNRGIVYYAFIEETGLSKVMLKFLSPADIKNVGLLTWEHGEEKEDDQWLYLPASKKVKRITSGGKKNKFMGTDYAFED